MLVDGLLHARTLPSDLRMQAVRITLRRQDTPARIALHPDSLCARLRAQMLKGCSRLAAILEDSDSGSRH